MLGWLELCLVMVPSGACLVVSSPDAPGRMEGPVRGRREQPACFGYRHADHARVLGRLLIGTGGELAGVAPVFGLVSGDGISWSSCHHDQISDSTLTARLSVVVQTASVSGRIRVRRPGTQERPPGASWSSAVAIAWGRGST